jgi:hypothetical protein
MDYRSCQLDLETRRKKQRALMARAVERKVRSRAQELYEMRGQQEGQELQDWFQAESEVLENNHIASVYRRLREDDSETSDGRMAEQASVCETGA